MNKWLPKGVAAAALAAVACLAAVGLAVGAPTAAVESGLTSTVGSAGTATTVASTTATGTTPTQTTAPDSVITHIDVPKTPMTHTDTLAFTWTAPYDGRATMQDYLAPQMREIFETMGLETTGQFIINEGAAKYTSDGTLLRSYDVIDNGNGKGIAILCYGDVSKQQETINIQVINKSIIVFPDKHDGGDDFWFVDVNGDGISEVVAKSVDIGADNVHATVGVFPIDNGTWGAPLFWSVGDVTWVTYMSYDFGFNLTKAASPFIIQNTLTGYTRTFTDPTDFPEETSYYAGKVEDMISNAYAADVDGDGVYELLVEQTPFRWNGCCYSLLKYDAQKQCFVTKAAAYILFDEMTAYSANDPLSGFRLFLKQNGYDPNTAFLQ
ncbi:MAG: hypothetical protein FWF49_03940 [Oscillospiraceae bacterium]|nr:hypothetical protein [Oscillospiraceae bacterium]